MPTKITGIYEVGPNITIEVEVQEPSARSAIDELKKVVNELIPKEEEEDK